MNGTYNYPAKPRNMWEIGVKAGLFTISGDVTPQPGLGYGLHIRKAFGYLFSLRLNYMEGKGRGLNWLPSGGYSNNEAWADRYSNATPATNVFYNYRSEVRDLSLEGVFTLNNIRFHKAKSGLNLYVLAGLGGMGYDVHVNALNDQGNAITNPFDPSLRYNFGSITGGTFEGRKETRNELKELLDDTYETQAQTHGERRPTIGNSTFRWVGHAGAGIVISMPITT
jgi:hypothetical protein